MDADFFMVLCFSVGNSLQILLTFVTSVYNDQSVRNFSYVMVIDRRCVVWVSQSFHVHIGQRSIIPFQTLTYWFKILALNVDICRKAREHITCQNYPHLDLNFWLVVCYVGVICFKLTIINFSVITDTLIKLGLW